MTTLPSPWDAYARIQKTLSKQTHINNQSWALEAALDQLLASTPQASSAPQEIDKTIATAERRERNRTVLRHKFLQASEQSSPDAEAILDAKRALITLKRRLPPKDWQMIRAVGLGYNYSEISRIMGVPPNALRTRVSRIREEFRAELSEPLVPFS